MKKMKKKKNKKKLKTYMDVLSLQTMGRQC